MSVSKKNIPFLRLDFLKIIHGIIAHQKLPLQILTDLPANGVRAVYTVFVRIDKMNGFQNIQPIR